MLTSQLQRGHPPQLAAAWSTQLTGGGRANTWDSQNRLRTCVTAQHTSAFTYGADGLRRQTVLDGQATTQYTLDSSMVIRENTTGGVNAGQVTYLCGPRGPEYRRTGLGQNAQVTWYCYDGLGSVLAEVSSTGYITGARQMDVYGAPRATQGSPTSTHAFVGGLGHPTEDDTGLIYMRARCMDPVTGPFVSEDPAEDGLSWFVYSAGDPVNGADAGGQKRLGIAFLLWFVAERLNANGWLAEDVGKLVTAGAEGAAVAVAWMEFVASMGTLLTLTRIGTKAHPLEAFKEAAYAAACAGALGVVTVSMAHQLELLWVMFNSNPDAPNDPQAVITRE